MILNKEHLKNKEEIKLIKNGMNNLRIFEKGILSEHHQLIKYI